MIIIIFSGKQLQISINMTQDSDKPPIQHRLKLAYLKMVPSEFGIKF